MAREVKWVLEARLVHVEMVKQELVVGQVTQEVAKILDNVDQTDNLDDSNHEMEAILRTTIILSPLACQTSVGIVIHITSISHPSRRQMPSIPSQRKTRICHKN